MNRIQITVLIGHIIMAVLESVLISLVSIPFLQRYGQNNTWTLVLLLTIGSFGQIISDLFRVAQILQIIWRYRLNRKLAVILVLGSLIPWLAFFLLIHELRTGMDSPKSTYVLLIILGFMSGFLGRAFLIWLSRG